MPVDDPVDVSFRGARFQVKAIIGEKAPSSAVVSLMGLALLRLGQQLVERHRAGRRHGQRRRVVDNIR